MFLDDDVFLSPNWFENAKKYMREDVGLLWGWDVICNRHSRNRMKVMYYLRHKSEYDLMRMNFEKRGGLHDTLIRREAVKGIRIPPDLHVYEDWYIKKYVEDRGYRAIAPRDVWCMHDFTPSYTPEALYEIAYLQRKYGTQRAIATLRNLGLAIPKSLAILLSTRDRKATIDQTKMYLYNFAGLFSCLVSGVS